MKRSTTVLFVLLVGLVGLVFVGDSFAQVNQGEKKKEESKIELIPVYEKTFDDTIVDVIFDTAIVSIEEAKTMGWKDIAFSEEEKRKGKARIEYPRVMIVANGKGIKFYDKTGHSLNTLKVNKWEKYEEVYTSPNGKYVLISKIPAEYNPEYSGGILYNNEGKRICEISGPTPIAVSDEGYTVAAYLDWQVPPESGGSFYIYNPAGELIKTIENPDNKNTAPLFAKYSKDGEYAVLVFKATTFPPTIIYLVKKTGEILWNKEFPEYRFSARGEEINLLTNKGLLLLLDKYDKKTEKRGKPYVSFIDWQGNLKWTVVLERRGTIILRVLEEEPRVFVVSEIGYIWCIELDSKKLLWQHKLPWAPGPGERWRWDLPRLKESIITDRTLDIIAMQGTDGVSSTLYIFNSKDGDLLNKTSYPGEKISFAKIGGNIGIINTAKCHISIFKMEVSK